MEMSMVGSDKGGADEGESRMTSVSKTGVRTCTTNDGWKWW